MINDTCANCGGDYGLHHHETDQCPAGGVDQSGKKRQKWLSTTFTPLAKPAKPKSHVEECEELAKEIESLATPPAKKLGRPRELTGGRAVVVYLDETTLQALEKQGPTISKAIRQNSRMAEKFAAWAAEHDEEP